MRTRGEVCEWDGIGLAVIVAPLGRRGSEHSVPWRHREGSISAGAFPVRLGSAAPLGWACQVLLFASRRAGPVFPGGRGSREELGALLVVLGGAARAACPHEDERPREMPGVPS